MDEEILIEINSGVEVVSLRDIPPDFPFLQIAHPVGFPDDIALGAYESVCGKIVFFGAEFGYEEDITDEAWGIFGKAVKWILEPEIPEPPEGKIVFSREGDIYIMDENGSNLMNITNTSNFRELEPTWSPDGSHIAFACSSGSAGNWERPDIWVMKPDGSGRINLTQTPDTHEEYPTWSPDGLRIAYVWSMGEIACIYAMNSDGTNQTPLTYGPADSTPSWSPDGTRILFSRDLTWPDSPSNHQIFVMDADGTSVQRLTWNDACEYYPSWSPDSSKIAFHSSRGGNLGRDQIIVMNDDGSNQTNITNNAYRNAFPRWSPDGSRIVFQRAASGSMLFEIWVMDADGTNAIQLTNTPGIAEVYPDWGIPKPPCEASFQGLGDLPGGNFHSQVKDVSADGTTVVGWSSSASGSREAFHWTESNGMVGLGDLPGDSFYSQAYSVSTDGSVVVGYGRPASGDEAFRWTYKTGMVGLGRLAWHNSSHGTGVSPDGSVVVGVSSTIGVGWGAQALRWTLTNPQTGEGTMVQLEDLPSDGVQSNGYGFSGDGSTIVGHHGNRGVGGSGIEACYWRKDSGGQYRVHGLGVVGVSYAATYDSSVIVGYMLGSSGQEAFRWTEATGVIGLGDLVGGRFLSHADDITDDGSVIVGFSETALGLEAVIWDSENNIRNLKEVLENEYGLNLTGWTLSWATGISDDGLTIVGYGINPDGNTEAWIARLCEPACVAIDYEFVAKWGTQGNGDGQFHLPLHIDIGPSGYVYVADRFNYRVQKFTSEGTFLGWWGRDDAGGTGWHGPSSGRVGSPGHGDGEFMHPLGIAVDSSGYVYVTDPTDHRVQKFTSNGTFLGWWGRDDAGGTGWHEPGSGRIGNCGSGDGEFGHPNGANGIAIDSSGYVYVTDYHNYRVQKFTEDGTFLGWWGRDDAGGTGWHEPGSGRIGCSGNGDGEFNGLHGIEVDSSGYVYVADGWNHRIQKFTNDGTFVTKWGTYGSDIGQFYTPMGVAVDQTGHVFVTELYGNRIQKFASDGEYITQWGSYGSENGQFEGPWDITFDSLGYAYISDYGNHRIQKFEAICEPVNTAPTADAGDDQEVSTGPDGEAEVFLDCSDSNDPDGDELTYTWFMDGEEIATGVNPTILLPCGTYIIELIVNDGMVDSEPDDVEITVLDGTPPAIECPDNVTLECPADTSPENTGLATATDDCDDEAAITYSDVLSGACPEVIVRTWTATDTSGNSSSCEQVITVQDTTPPTITCPADITLELECPADTTPAATGSATATDTCGSVTITHSDLSVPGCGNTEVITRTWTATDECGNSSNCVQTIEVVDTTPPVITCPADVTLECPADTSPGATGSATANDTCGSVTITHSDVTVPGCGNTKVITR
ncbi:MAG: PKD domain-containing protein, partial [Planctomycetota bacterium]